MCPYFYYKDLTHAMLLIQNHLHVQGWISTNRREFVAQHHRELSCRLCERILHLRGTIEGLLGGRRESSSQPEVAAHFNKGGRRFNNKGGRRESSSQPEVAALFFSRHEEHGWWDRIGVYKYISAKAPQQIFDSCFHSAADEAKAKASR